MAKIAFILLCHKDPEAIVAQALRLTAMGDCISIHFDGRAPDAQYAQVHAALKDNPNVAFARRRVKCGWGEWSLVEATLEALSAAVTGFPRATHFYMLSGDCMPIKSGEYAHEFLDANDVDFIESFDFFDSNWIKTGMKGDRLFYRHFVNERRHKWLFYTMLNVQRRLGLRRDVPGDLQVMIGSQWWCLRRRTVEWVLDFVRQRPDVLRFFRSTWIPDETFFQTLVPHLVPEREIRTRTLTFLMFTDYGMPVTFYNDHYDLLLSQNYLFARKISPGATELKQRLGDLYASTEMQFNISDEGRSLYRFLAARGRQGRRYAPRFWEQEATLGRERELMLLVCKKWHVAKRLLEKIQTVTGLPCVEYVFSEDSCPLPDLGGIQATIEKRTRHRRALMRMLFDYHGSDRLVMCLDPSDIDLMRDFYSDRSSTRLLEIRCDFSDNYLRGHARRTGLAGAGTSVEALNALLPTVRADFAHESDEIRDASFPNAYRLRENGSEEENVLALARFLDIPENQARDLAHTDHLFVD